MCFTYENIVVKCTQKLPRQLCENSTKGTYSDFSVKLVQTSTIQDYILIEYDKQFVIEYFYSKAVTTFII